MFCTTMAFHEKSHASTRRGSQFLQDHYIEWMGDGRRAVQCNLTQQNSFSLSSRKYHAHNGQRWK